MTIQTTRLSDPAVRAFVAAVNAHDREAFLALLAPDATMADDGDDRDLDQWIDQEIFSSNGHMEVEHHLGAEPGRAHTEAGVPGRVRHLAPVGGA
ncbi:nuclear transport factor 2 family protein, partial [Streptomyces sp. NPDC044948]|uniref:nuclear transport factor 2 family protein n=1 Tax=Streptomyces sp. NPDC044948 TaxID=3157092 RepID=UPI00340FD2C4